MPFHSYLFVLCFLPVTVSVYYILRRTGKYILPVFFLLIMSLCFYYSGDGGHPSHLIFLAADILANYTVYLLLQRSYARHPGAVLWRKILLFCAVAGNLSFLLLFKYFNFFADVSNALFRTQFPMLSISVPLGISYITFGQIAFIADTYRQDISGCNFMEYALFTLFFPKVSSGPITRCREFVPALQGIKNGRIDWDRLAGGLYLFGMGLGKKALIADHIGKFVDYGYGNINSLSTFQTWLVVIAYSFRIYFDFSGYSDMAIGIARILDLELPVNFRSPYQSASIVEFWKRWHITLTGFLTAYLYIPLGGNRRGKIRTVLNILIVFCLSGLWHGASLTFVLWGFVHGIGQVVTREFGAYFKKVPRLIGCAFTFIFVTLAWVLFRAETLTDAALVYRKLIGICGVQENMELYTNLQIPLIHNIAGGGLPGWIDAVIVLAVIAVIVFFGRSAEERSHSLHYKAGEGLWLIIVIAASIFTFSSGVNSYIYSGF